MKTVLRPGTVSRATALAALMLAVLAWVGTTGTFAGFPGSTVTNSVNSAASATLSFRHDYQSTSCALQVNQGSSTDCPGHVAPTAVPGSTTDSVTNLGTTPADNLTESVGAASCGPVQLANTPDAGNAMLPRYGVGFHSTDYWGGTSAITLDGSSGYVAAVKSQAEPNPLVSLGGAYGLGIWFKTTSTTGGPLFEVGSKATAASSGDDRILYLNPNGTLSFIQNTSGAKTTTSASFNNGAWHFAYVTMSAINVLLGVDSTTTIYVDGAAAGTGGGLLVGYSSDTGYWHLGWAPTSATGLSSAYFAGSLSEFVVFDNPGAPAPPSANSTSRSAFESWASAATERWALGDSGTTTFAGPYPWTGGASPCTMVDTSWTLTSPGGSVATLSLSAFVAGSPHPVPAPGPGTTQTVAITTSRDSTYIGDVSGLHLSVPFTFSVNTRPASNWSLTFRWPGASAVIIA